MVIQGPIAAILPFHEAIYGTNSIIGQIAIEINEMSGIKEMFANADDFRSNRVSQISTDTRSRRILVL